LFTHNVLVLYRCCFVYVLNGRGVDSALFEMDGYRKQLTN
jgi:hypothetical protein